MRTVFRPAQSRRDRPLAIGGRLSRRPSFEILEDRRLLTITVNTAVDEADGSITDGDISLRDAIALAPVGEMINFQASLSGGVIHLTQGELRIDRSLAIDASGLPVRLTIDAAGNDPTPTVDQGDGSRSFQINDNAATNQTVVLRGLAITGGDVTGNGGAILSRESLTLANCVVQGNAATANGGGVWASVENSASLSIEASTISGNAAGNRGGGVYSFAASLGAASIRDSTVSGNTAVSDGGGAHARTIAGGATTISQSTFSGNSANWRGGGVFAYTLGGTVTTIVHSTITANTADADANNPMFETGGGIYVSSSGNVKLENSIVAANVNPGNVAPDLRNGGSALSARYNLIGTNSGSGLAAAPINAPDANGNMIGGPGAAAINPGLEPLASNGGPTQTRALLPTSAAVNRGDPSLVAGTGGTPTNDQRGDSFSRVQKGPGTILRIDVGAYELSDSATPSVLRVDTLVDDVDGDISAGHFSLREAIEAANRLGSSTIEFAPQLSGQVINLALGELVVTRAMTIDGGTLAAPITIDARSQSRVFRVATENDPGPAIFKGLTIAGGKAPGTTVATYGGAIRVESGGLNITDCTIRNNLGGGIATAVGLKIANSTFAYGTGPAIHQYVAGGTGLDVTDCSITGFASDGIRLVGASLALTRSTVSGNNNAGISASANSNVTIRQSTIADSGFGGVVLTDSDATLTDCTVSGNRSGISGDSSSSISMTGCTFTNNANRAISTAGPLTILNTTISNNADGGIVASTSSLTVAPTIRFSTIVGNKGIGISVGIGTHAALIENSIISGNTGSADLTGYVHLRYSIVGRAGSMAPINDGGSIIGTAQNPVDPHLGPLTNNGGPTLTHAPLSGSIAFNAGDPAAEAGSETTPLFDQRGADFPRIVGGRVDIGAVEVSAFNTDPQILSPSAASVPENTTAVLTVMAIDADLPPQTITFSIVGGADAARFNVSKSGALSFSFKPNYESPQDVDGDNIYLVTIKADDGHGGSDTQEFMITVSPVNEFDPVILSASAISVPENTAPVMPVTATDADLPAQTISFSIVGGADASRFFISPTGALSFKQAPDFEAPADADHDNVYIVTVRASSNFAGGFSDKTITVTVTAVNDNSPVFTSPTNAVVPENTLPVMVVTATDADVPAQGINFSIVGGVDAARFNITADGTLAFKTPPDFEAPTDSNGDNVYVVTVQANDGAGRLSQQTVNVTVVSPKDFGDAPDPAPGAGHGNYQTSLLDNGPSHRFVDGLRLGARFDSDTGLVQNTAANGDDVGGGLPNGLPDDEDGVSNPAADLTLTVGAQPTVAVRATNLTTTAATLYGWIDYNADGVFSNATERASVAVPGGTNNGLATLVFPVVPSGYTGVTYARFRLSADAAAAAPTGPAIGGEVEDYRAAIVRPGTGLSNPAKLQKIADNNGVGPNLSNSDQFGDSVAALGDLDGDGVGDLAVGAMRSGGDTGAVYILFMKPNGTVKSLHKIANGTDGVVLASDDRFGRSVAALGDLDGDGVVDLAVGADRDDTVGQNRGAVHILFLKANGTVKAVKKIASNTNGGPALADGDYFGIAAAGLGDVDGDGIADLAVGAFLDDTGGADRGAAYVLFLNADGSVKASQKIANGVGGGPTLADGDLFARSLASPGDLDGDGVSDLAVGVVRDDTGGNNRGAVQVLYLNANCTVKASQKIASGIGGGPVLADGDQFGFAVGARGDIDGDGVADLGVGANYDDAGGNNRGALHVLYLNANGTVKDDGKIANGVGGGPTLANGDYFGTSVAALGDLDGDGLMDLAVGAEFDDTGAPNSGAVHVLFLQAYSPPGDFDASGVVDGADLSVWRSHFGAKTGATSSTGDADGDHDVDGNDFLAWQRNLGRSAAVSTSAAAQAALLDSPMLDASADHRVTSSLASADSSTSVAWLAAAATQPAHTGAASTAITKQRSPQTAEYLAPRMAPRRAQAAGDRSAVSPGLHRASVDSSFAAEQAVDAAFDDESTLCDWRLVAG